MEQEELIAAGGFKGGGGEKHPKRGTRTKPHNILHFKHYLQTF